MPVAPGEHVLEEILVPRDVDDPCLDIRGEVEAREAQIYREPPLPLLQPAVRLDPGQRPYEGGLAVIHVAGRPDDDAVSIVHVSARHAPTGPFTSGGSGTEGT